MTDHANELRRYAPLLGRPTMMLAAADEIESLLDRLKAAEKEREALLEALKHIARTAIARATGEQP